MITFSILWRSSYRERRLASSANKGRSARVRILISMRLLAFSFQCFWAAGVDSAGAGGTTLNLDPCGLSGLSRQGLKCPSFFFGFFWKSVSSAHNPDTLLAARKVRNSPHQVFCLRFLVRRSLAYFSKRSCPLGRSPSVMLIINRQAFRFGNPMRCQRRPSTAKAMAFLYIKRSKRQCSSKVSYEPRRSWSLGL